MEPDTSDDSKHFGIWPAVIGFALAALIIYSMFKLATGIL